MMNLVDSLRKSRHISKLHKLDFINRTFLILINVNTGLMIRRIRKRSTVSVTVWAISMVVCEIQNGMSHWFFANELVLKIIHPNIRTRIRIFTPLMNLLDVTKTIIVELSSFSDILIIFIDGSAVTSRFDAVP